jgi:hypothetical protein
MNSPKRSVFESLLCCSLFRTTVLLALISGGYDLASAAPMVSKLYLAVQQDPVIRRSNLDGSKFVELYRTPGGGVPYLAIDADADSIYFPSAEAGGIQMSNLTGGDVSLRISVDKYVMRVGIHPQSNTLFWADIDNEIWRYNLNDDTRSMIFDDDLSIVTSIAADPNRDYFYWTDRGIGRIMRTSADGSETKTLVGRGPFGSYLSPTGLALDATRGTLYFSDSLFDSILQVNVDGTHPAVLTSEGVINPTAVAFDEIGQRVYWANTNGAVGVSRPYDHYIMSAKLDGTDVRPEFIPRNQWGGALRINQMAIVQIPVPEGSATGMIAACAIGGATCNRRKIKKSQFHPQRRAPLASCQCRNGHTDR